MSRLGITYGRPNVLTVMRTNLLSVTGNGEQRKRGSGNRGCCCSCDVRGIGGTLLVLFICVHSSIS